MTALDQSARISAAQAEDALSRWEAMTGTQGVPHVSGPSTEPYSPMGATAAFPATQALTDPFAAAPGSTTAYPVTPYPAAQYPPAPYPATGQQHSTTSGQHPATSGQYLATGGIHPANGPQHGGQQDRTQQLGSPATDPFGRMPGGTGTVPLVTGPTTAGGSMRVAGRSAGRGRTTAIVMWLLVAALLVAGALLAPMVMSSLNSGGSSSGAGAPSYPPVSGELGTVLKDLQESVK
jgi:hypothetical protein